MTLLLFSGRYFCNFPKISCFVGSFFTENAMVLHQLPLTCSKCPFFSRLKANLLSLLIPYDISLPSFVGFSQILGNLILASYHHWSQIQLWFQVVYWWEGELFLVVFPSFPKIARESVTFHKISELLMNFFQKPLVAVYYVAHVMS